MPQLEYFLVCESVAIDQATNRISLFNVLEELHVLSPGSTSKIPLSIVSQCVAVSCWNREDGDEGKDFEVTVRIHNPSPDIKPVDLSPLNIRMDRRRMRLTLRLQGLPELCPGQLKFELLLNGEHVAWHSINVSPTEDEASVRANGSEAETTASNTPTPE